jgi:hypothetical protein
MLDRGGVAAKTAVEVGASVEPFEAILGRLESGSRAAFRRSVGREDDSEVVTSTQAWESPALPLCAFDDDDDELIVDGEVCDDNQDTGQPIHTR